MSKRDGNSEIYVMNADGSGQRNLTRNPAHDHSGLVARRTEDRLRSRRRDLRHERRRQRAAEPDAQPGADGNPAWSPDGRKIAFATKRDGNLEVYVMNADGSGQRNLTRSPWNEGSASWSPAQKK